MTIKHTPGPALNLERFRRVMQVANDLQKKRDFAPHQIVSMAQQMSNFLVEHRALIAAAPEMLEAVRAAVAFTDHYQGVKTPQWMLDARVLLARLDGGK